MESFLTLLKTRFDPTMHLHPHTDFAEVLALLSAQPAFLEKIAKMEALGGQPELVEFDSQLMYVDLIQEQNEGRCNICYDEPARLSRKKFAPSSSALKILQESGLDLIDEDLYLHLQTLVDIDVKTSTWIKTDDSIRRLGGALFGDKRYHRAFIYHNGADSYYSVRGFRAVLRIK